MEKSQALPVTLIWMVSDVGWIDSLDCNRYVNKCKCTNAKSCLLCFWNIIWMDYTRPFNKSQIQDLMQQIKNLKSSNLIYLNDTWFTNVQRRWYEWDMLQAVCFLLALHKALKLKRCRYISYEVCGLERLTWSPNICCLSSVQFEKVSAAFPMTYK